MKKLVLKKSTDVTASRGYRIAYEDVLNPAQLEAVFHTTGPALVLAGAGTGKTRTLTYRVARLVEDGVDPASILLLTFTRKAARQMVQRASVLLDGRCEKVAGGTFHSFAYGLAQRFRAGLQNDQRAVQPLRILDQGDAADVMSIVRARLVAGPQRRRFPQAQTLAAMASAAVNRMQPVDEVIAQSYRHYGDDVEQIRSVIQAYQSYKQQHGLFDYDDLLLYAASLTHDATVGPILRSQYRFVMVDEYQDTNALQHGIVMGLTGRAGNVLVVGDDAQSIYSFRGSDVEHIRRFPETVDHCRVIRLEHNYRSTQPVLDVCNAVILHAPGMYEKELFSSQADGEPPKLISCVNERQQSAFVVQRVLELREEGVPLSNIAVLFRSGFLSFDLEIELRKANIPFVKVGGMRFTEAAHVKDLLAMLRLTVNTRDVVSWYRILQMVPGVGAKTAQDFIDAIAQGADPGAPETITPAKTAVLVDAIRTAQGVGSPLARVQSLASVYRPWLEKKHDDHAKRWADIETMMSIVAAYATCEQFLDDVAVDPPHERIEGMEADDGDDEHMVLSTIHSAKGLEWHTVFVIWANEGRLPSFRSSQTEEALEEERRLLYVACTRARQDLLLTYPSIMLEMEHGDVLGIPSRFLEGCAEESLPRYVLTE